MPEASERTDQDEAVLRFVERFSTLFSEAGVPKMAARVFVALVSSHEGRLTSADLAEMLKISPAAVSGAVRYLTQVDLIARDREPGSRREVYRVFDDLWYETIFRRDQMLLRWQNALDEGVTVLGEDTRGGRRLAEMRAFFEFVHEELPLVMDRWRTYRASRFPPS
ncbi:GbsR/MarR family transcriptional regulator [Umezawaea beigongshangensis]|uniref:GbsR/MarR family transcriptional regulator n=1 Tax=Umezawaea beigongshangensis TaxID=2780383 RepID=UPI0018F1F867|nr:MarR family transcriptional regulator [Umezawaea beigongshangensis]